MKYIAWRFFNDRRPAYVAEINTSGKGDRYGYVSREDQAIPISDTEWKRFSRYMYDVGSVGFCAPFPDRKSNPARKTSAKKPAAKPAAKRAYVNRPSQATKKPPTKRLKARRAANVRGSGMFPNPKPRWAFDVQDADKGIYSVHSRTGKGYVKVAEFRDYKHAVEYAEAYANAHNKQTKVTGNLGKAGSSAKSGIINRNW